MAPAPTLQAALSALGYDESFPKEATHLVAKLVNDLCTTTDSLRCAKEELTKEKANRSSFESEVDLFFLSILPMNLLKHGEEIRRDECH